MQKCVLGIDIGTSSAKAAFYTLDGKCIGMGQSHYAIDAPREGWAQQQPETWWNAVKHAVKAALAELGDGEIVSVGLSGQMHGLVLLGRDEHVLYPAIIWADQRSTDEVECFYQHAGRENLNRITANSVVTGFFGPSLLWVKRNEPKVYAAACHAILPKDYIRFRLTGCIATECTDASATALFDVSARRWSGEICSAVDIDEALLPECRESTDIAGYITAKAAAETGLPAGIPVAFGGGDQPMQALGNGVAKPGSGTVNIGTAGQVCTPLDEPLHDPMLRTNTYCHTGGRWYIMGGPLAAGLSLNWHLQLFDSKPDYNRAYLDAQSIPAGANGLLYLPYLIGERTPHLDPFARGAFIGLTLRHDRACLTRAVMEGVAFALRQSLDIMEEMGITTDHLIASGGGTSHPVWRQIMADVFNRPIWATQAKEQACLGAAITAAAVAGCFDSPETACTQMCAKPSAKTEPDPENVQKYRELYLLYKKAYTANREIFHQLSAQEGRKS